MSFSLVWSEKAAGKYRAIEIAAKRALENRKKSKRTKSSRIEGLFKQLRKCVKLLKENPKHPSLRTHEYRSIENPYEATKKVFEAYAQQSLSPA
jgi:hypothetical protein